tara:strand:+ start:3180 stop:3362 length:183 start_codon:yes stop_codon:yes gene_type:complete
MVELFVVLICYNPEINSLKQEFLEENKIAVVATHNPEEVCFYTELEAYAHEVGPSALPFS